MLKKYIYIFLTLVLLIYGCSVTRVKWRVNWDKDKKEPGVNKPLKSRQQSKRPGIGSPDKSGPQNSVSNAQRYAPDYPGFRGKDLTPDETFLQYIKRKIK